VYNIIRGRAAVKNPDAEIQNEKETHMKLNFMKKVFKILSVTSAILICLLSVSATAGCAFAQNSTTENSYVKTENNDQPATSGYVNTENAETACAPDAGSRQTTTTYANSFTSAAASSTETSSVASIASETAASKASETTAESKANVAAAGTTAAATAAKASETAKKLSDNRDSSVSSNSSSVLDIERKVVELVNQARKANGLPELILNEKLSNVARVKANDMADNSYFSHTSPTYGSPFDMMRQFGISYRTAGENIAMGQTTAQQVFDAWMNSEGHRANILNPSFTEIGVGYSANGSYWSQMFIG
jgi:uncharacterized YkwD family protein